MSGHTIKDTADLLGVTTVRVHGLISSGKLKLTAQPLSVQGRFVKAVTDESIELFLAERKRRAAEVTRNKTFKEKKAAEPRDGRKQYILVLTSGEIAELMEQVPELNLRPRFAKNARGATGPEPLNLIEDHDAITDSNELDEFNHRPPMDEEWDGLPRIEQPVSEYFLHAGDSDEPNLIEDRYVDTEADEEEDTWETHDKLKAAEEYKYDR